jgi:hypothetical protein
MVVRLPYGLHRAFREEHLLLAQEWRTLARRGRGAVAPVDRRLLLRMVDAIEVGLDQIEACRADQYEGPRAELVRRVESEHLRSFEVEASGRNCVLTPASLASTIVGEIAEAHPEALELRWMEIGYAVPLCQNDACEAAFEPIVRADAAATLWHVAASLFTWAHSGVWTPPILADTLRRWAGASPAVDRWCRTEQDAGDPYVRFMAAYATRLVDGHVERHEGDWLQRYCELVA